jgi:heme iron utilization protein
MDSNAKTSLHALLDLPIAALGTLHQGAPFVSMVPVVPAPDGSGFLIHVSRLAQHTSDLLADTRVSLMFQAPLGKDQDPLSLPRVTLQSEAQPIVRDSEAYASAVEAYLARFPQAELTLGLGDFSFIRILPTSGRLVSGFGRALSLDARQIQAGLS